MPFLAQKHLPIPNKDLLSWMFDDPKYDLDQPVSTSTSKVLPSGNAKVRVRLDLYRCNKRKKEAVCEVSAHPGSKADCWISYCRAAEGRLRLRALVQRC